MALHWQWNNDHYHLLGLLSNSMVISHVDVDELWCGILFIYRENTENIKKGLQFNSMLVCLFFGEKYLKLQCRLIIILVN